MKSPGMTKTDLRNNLKGEMLIKELTFSNTAAGTVNLFSVVGDVICRVIVVCKTTVASAAAANIRCGCPSNTELLIADTVAANIANHEIWHDATPDCSAELESVSKDVILSSSNNITLVLDAQVDSGALTFYCFWIPLSTNGSVTV